MDLEVVSIARRFHGRHGDPPEEQNAWKDKPSAEEHVGPRPPSSFVGLGLSLPSLFTSPDTSPSTALARVASVQATGLFPYVQPVCSWPLSPEARAGSAPWMPFCLIFNTTLLSSGVSPRMPSLDSIDNP